MFCKNCGKQLDDHVKFCPHCGTKLQAAAPAPAPAKEPAASATAPAAQPAPAPAPKKSKKGLIIGGSVTGVAALAAGGFFLWQQLGDNGSSESKDKSRKYLTAIDDASKLVEDEAYEEAIEQYLKAAEMEKDNSEALKGLNEVANIYFTQSDYKAAIEVYQYVLKEEKNNKKAKAGLAKCYIECGKWALEEEDWQDAREFFEKALKADSGNEEAREALAALEGAGGVWDAYPYPGDEEVAVAVPAATPEPEPEEISPYGPLLTDANGNVYDLGGMEIIIRDWWSDPNAEPDNQYDEDTEAYREFIQKTYNFKIRQMAISDWGSAPRDFLEYASFGGDDNNFVFILRDDPALTSAMVSGLCYDLSTLDCLDFSEQKFTSNLLHKQYSKGGKIYAMYAGASDPCTGVYFNKRILEEAGINPEEIYDKQANGTWTWDAFLEYLDKVQQDTNNDGVIDIYGANANNSSLTNAAVFSNGGEYVGQDASGKYIYRLEDAQTLEGLAFAQQIFDTYWQVEPEGAGWDYYMEGFLNGEYAFMIEDAYVGKKGGFLANMEDAFGFVMFPKGPKMNDYTNCWTNKPAVIPACYDAERAWKIAFAWNLYTNETPGYEYSDAWKADYYSGYRDTRAVDETLDMMRTKGMITYDGMIPDLFRGYLTLTMGPGSDFSARVEEIRDTWKYYIDSANQ